MLPDFIKTDTPSYSKICISIRSYHVDKYYDDMNLIDCDCEIWYHPTLEKPKMERYKLIVAGLKKKKKKKKWYSNEAKHILTLMTVWDYESWY